MSIARSVHLTRPNQKVRVPTLGQILLNLGLIALSLVVLLPIIWLIISSLKGPVEYYQPVPSPWVAHPTLVNYAYMWTQMGKVPRYLANSAIVTFGAVFLQVTLSALAGYSFARIEWRGRNAVFYLIVLSLFVPRSGGLMALYEEMSYLSLRNNLLGLVLLFGSYLPVPIFIMRQTFLGVPRELEDAARIDGANWWQVFWWISAPLGTAGMVVVAILGFVAVWGDFLVTFTMIDNPNLLTISVAVQNLMVTDTNTAFMAQDFADKFATGAADAALLLTAIAPVVILYLFLQRWFVRGLTEGVLKL